MKHVLSFGRLLENFKNQKDQDLYHKVLAAVKGSMSQLAICKALGFDSYDMRTTMVIREMTLRGELLCDKSQKPMTFSVNPDYKEGETQRVQVEQKPKKEGAAPSARGAKAKKELADQIAEELFRFVKSMSQGNIGDKRVDNLRDGGININVDTRDLGNWEHDYEDYDREEEDFEDDDQMIWSSESRKFYNKKFKEWMTGKEWKRKVKDYGISTSEKNWVEFYITLK